MLPRNVASAAVAMGTRRSRDVMRKVTKVYSTLYSSIKRAIFRQVGSVD